MPCVARGWVVAWILSATGCGGLLDISEQTYIPADGGVGIGDALREVEAISKGTAPDGSTSDAGTRDATTDTATGTRDAERGYRARGASKHAACAGTTKTCNVQGGLECCLVITSNTADDGSTQLETDTATCGEIDGASCDYGISGGGAMYTMFTSQTCASKGDCPSAEFCCATMNDAASFLRKSAESDARPCAMGGSCVRATPIAPRRRTNASPKPIRFSRASGRGRASDQGEAERETAHGGITTAPG